MSIYYIYMLECWDGSIYTGITTDLERRYREHLSGGPKAAKYTRLHLPVSIRAAWTAPDRAAASRLEYRIKALPREKKLALIENGGISELNLEGYGIFRDLPEIKSSH